jgi:small subunit ribosomal protein S2
LHDKEETLSQELADQLLEAGVHFGHQTRKWNPKMKKYIYGSKNGVYIIDLAKTTKLLEKACKFVSETTAKGGLVLFVGTKPQARLIIREEAEACNMPYVNNRWLGGFLTNFDTIKKSVKHYLGLKENVANGLFDQISKKEASMITKEIGKLEKNLLGISAMGKLPAAIFVVDAKRELIAVKEAVRLNIPVIAIADTDADPDLIAFPIPANDDAVRSVKLIMKKITTAIKEGQAAIPQEEEQIAPAVEASAEKPAAEAPAKA